MIIKILLPALFFLNQLSLSGSTHDTCCILVPFSQDGKWGFKNCDGQIILEPRYTDCLIDANSSYYRYAENNLWGIINANGGVVQKPKYAEINSLAPNTDNFFVAKNQDGRWGVFTLNESIVIEYKYDFIIYLGNSCFIGVLGNENYFFNVDQNIVTQLSYEISRPHLRAFIYQSYNGLFSLLLTDGNNLILNNSGRRLIIRGMNLTHHVVKGNKYIVKENEKIGIVDSVGNVLIPLMYEYIEPINGSLFIVKLNGKYNIINDKEEVLMEWKKDAILVLNDSFVSINNSKKGVMNVNNHKMIIDFKYDKISTFIEGDKIYFMCIGKKYSSLHDEKGEIFRSRSKMMFFYDNLILTSLGEVYNLKGEIVYKFDKKLGAINLLPCGVVYEVISKRSVKYFNIQSGAIISEVFFEE